MSNQPAKPLLTVGMIVKNEIRCIERCLQSLQPLRAALPCELIIADTGSTDGTREVCEQYADVLFDFEWINDFAAARNAVLDKAQGEWFFTVDADEWLDADFSSLTAFLQHPELWENVNICAVTQRNYRVEDFEVGAYGDFSASRIFRRTPGVKFVGEIHESPALGEPYYYYILSRVVLHHDGYISADEQRGEGKQERNMALLKKKLEKNPNSLLVLQQCIESGIETPEAFQYIQQALEGVEQKWDEWQVRGPIIYRHAAAHAVKHQLPTFWHYVERARELFPDALITRTEVNALAFWQAKKEKKWEKAIAYAKENLRAVADYRAARYNLQDFLHCSINTLSPAEENNLRLQLADVYLEQQDYASALATLENIDAGKLDYNHAGAMLGNLMNLQARSDLELTESVVRFWEQLTAADGGEKRRNQRLAAAAQTAAPAFLPKFRQEECEKDYPRHAYTLLLPLAERCDLGRAAALLDCEDVEQADRLLAAVEDFDAFPAGALAHALDIGAAFPPAGRTLPMETLDGLANRLTGMGDDYLPTLCVCMPLPEDGAWETPGDENWARALLLAAVQHCDFEACEVSFTLCRHFAAFERAFLPRQYAPRCLTDENLSLLPPLHRFGALLPVAFDALDAGDKEGYIRGLRMALTTCESMKPMVEFLMNALPDDSDETAELTALAAQVKAMLSAFPEGDPRLQALRESDAYRRVAFLLEDGPAHEGLPPS